ncbi:hypothetical protein JB92DRAFT_3161845 [Gautieria morchelliformis]|nr:hypothetical protein JB92DRAFT_3161845 [Gautieria morchelliformis]
MYTLAIDDVAEALHYNGIEINLFLAQKKVVLPQSVKDNIEVLLMLSYREQENEYVVHVDMDEATYAVVENGCHQPLECRWGVTVSHLYEGTLIPYTNTSSAPLNLSIPKIVRSRKGVEGLPAWKQAVRDWEAADPQRGHNVALKDWRPEWLTGKFKPLFAQMYYNEKLLRWSILNGGCFIFKFFPVGQNDTVSVTATITPFSKHGLKPP